MSTRSALLRDLSAHPTMERPGFRQAKAGARWVRERYALATWDDRVLPELLLVGAQRCGTTSLTEALYALPVVERPRRGKGSHYFSYNYWRGWEWFRSQFPTRRTADRTEAEHGHRLVCFDACPYYLFHPFALERQAAALPDARILVMLRDPVRRAESHYHHSVSHGHEVLPFAEALDREEERLDGEVEKMRVDVEYWSHHHEHHSYLSKGRYAEQLERLFSLYDRDQVMVIQAEAFYRSPEDHLARIADWVGLPHPVYSGAEDRNAHSYRPMDEAIRARLVDYYREPNEVLYELLGLRYDWLG